MLADVLIGLSLWTGTSVITALVLGRILQRGKVIERGEQHTTARRPLSDVA
jgi:hypothetical protein